MTPTAHHPDQSDIAALARLLPTAPAQLAPDRRDALRDHVLAAIRISSEPGRASTRPAHLHRFGWILAGAAAVAVGATALGLLGGQSQAAWAISRDGATVHVTIRDASDTAGLDRALRADGVPVTLVPVTTSCTEPAPTALPAGVSVWISDPTTVDIVGTELPPGAQVLLGIDVTDGHVVVEAELAPPGRSCFPDPFHD